MERMTALLGELGSKLIDPVLIWLASIEQKTLLLAALGVMLIFVLRKTLTSWLIRFAVFIGGKIDLTISVKVQETIAPAVQALIISLSLLVCLEILKLPSLLSETLEKLLISVVVAAVFTAAYWLTDVFGQLLMPYRTSRTAIQVDWLERLAKVTVAVIGVAAVLKVWEIDIGPVLTGMGVLGAGVALAAKDLFTNLIAGFTNMSEKRFQVGDWVRVEGVIEGTVERVEFRSALIRGFDMAPVFVPNAALANATLTNFSRMPHRRIYWNVGIVYSATADQLVQICKEIEGFIADSPEYVSEAGVASYAKITGFNASSIDLLVYCFAKSPTFADYVEAKEKLTLAIKRAVEGAGTSIAFPSRSIYVEGHDEGGVLARLTNNTGKDNR